ncbi:MAG: hypothetical protein H2056_08085 [Sphingopyxis sp.]|nr:hypothetical protein [Sphingopyxis sp.]
MASAAHGSTRTVSWFSPSTPLPVANYAPLFAANDIGEAPYRAVHDAARRLWRDHGADAPFIAANRAQGAFWHGRMDACRWWHSVGRMLDRALLAGGVGRQQVFEAGLAAVARQAPVNS